MRSFFIHQTEGVGKNNTVDFLQIHGPYGDLHQELARDHTDAHPHKLRELAPFVFDANEFPQSIEQIQCSDSGQKQDQVAHTELERQRL
jgi:hypothetical protein